MSNPETKVEGSKDEKACCGKKACGCGCKALAVLALLAIGGLGGYAAARHCAAKDAPPAASLPK